MTTNKLWILILLPKIKKYIWALLGPKFGEDVGQKAIALRALHGFNSAVAALRSHLVNFMRQLRHESNKADPLGLQLPRYYRDLPLLPVIYWVEHGKASIESSILPLKNSVGKLIFTYR